MNLLKEYELEKRKVINLHNTKELHFYCGICEKKCYQDRSSGLTFFKKVILNHNKAIDTKYSRYSKYEENGEVWMKVCFRCKYNNKLLTYCPDCGDYYLKNIKTLKNRCSVVF